MKKIILLASTFVFLVCGVAVCSAASAQSPIEQSAQIKTMGKKRRGKKLPQAQAKQASKNKKKKGSKGLMRSFITFSGAALGATIGAGLGFATVGLIFRGLIIVWPIAMDILIFSPIGVYFLLVPVFMGTTTGLCYGAWKGWNLIDAAFDSENYELVSVSVPEID